MRVALAFVAMFWLVGGTTVASGDEPRTAPPGGTATGRPNDEKAIRAADESFIRAYNAADSKAIAELFAEDAEAVEGDGEPVRGRKAIASLFAAIFEDSPGAKLEITTDSLRFLGPDAALETGRTSLTPTPGERPVVSRFTVVYVKRDGRWVQSYVREHSETLVPPHEHLKDLEWIVGEWVEEARDAVVSMSCRWSDDKNYLLRDFSIQVLGRPALSGTERIGWDPLTKQFRSWVFDSNGGYGEGHWTRRGNEWVIKSSGVREDGRRVSSTQILTLAGPHSARWMVVDRTLGGKAVPDFDEIVMVKKPPKPR